METLGQHLLVEYHGCEADILDDPQALDEALRRAADAAAVRVVGCVVHQFAPQGVSGVVIIEESHLSIHTWPERGYVAADFYTCGQGQPRAAHGVLVDALRPRRSELLEVRRGVDGAPSSLDVRPIERDDHG